MTDTHRLTDAEIDELLRLEAEATPARWFDDSYSTVLSAALVKAEDTTIAETYETLAWVAKVPAKYGDTAPPGSRQRADARFIPAIRNCAHALLTEVKEARRVLTALNHECQELDVTRSLTQEDLDSARRECEELKQWKTATTAELEISREQHVKKTRRILALERIETECEELRAALDPPSGYCQWCGHYPIDGKHAELHRTIDSLRAELAKGSAK